jgi:glycosyltransferase involved in cell wall biosynthesis
MRASVIISTYQRPAYLPDVLASVVAQDFPKDEYEILVVDNASQPTSALAAQYSPLLVPPVCYVHEPRNGLHNARHTGADRPFVEEEDLDD